MYVVLTSSKSIIPLSDLMPAIIKEFPDESFSIQGSEEKGFQLRIEGVGDEKNPRKFSEKFLKNWKPSIL